MHLKLHGHYVIMVVVSTCSELTCQRVCGEYKEDSNGCKTCECEGNLLASYIAIYIKLLCNYE